MIARIKPVEGEEYKINLKESDEVVCETPFIFIKNNETLSHIINMAECQMVSFEE